jgi:hypothetical protein
MLQFNLSFQRRPVYIILSLTLAGKSKFVPWLGRKALRATTALSGPGPAPAHRARGGSTQLPTRPSSTAAGGGRRFAPLAGSGLGARAAGTQSSLAPARFAPYPRPALASLPEQARLECRGTSGAALAAVKPHSRPPATSGGASQIAARLDQAKDLHQRLASSLIGAQPLHAAPGAAPAASSAAEPVQMRGRLKQHASYWRTFCPPGNYAVG